VGPETRSRHATCAYSCTTPRRRSRRNGRTVAPRWLGSAAGWRLLIRRSVRAVCCSAPGTPAAPRRGGEVDAAAAVLDHDAETPPRAITLGALRAVPRGRRAAKALFTGRDTVPGTHRIQAESACSTRWAIGSWAWFGGANPERTAHQASSQSGTRRHERAGQPGCDDPRRHFPSVGFRVRDEEDVVWCDPIKPGGLEPVPWIMGLDRGARSGSRRRRWFRGRRSRV
jgi:hypothetical protein